VQIKHRTGEVLVSAVVLGGKTSEDGKYADVAFSVEEALRLCGTCPKCGLPAVNNPDFRQAIIEAKAFNAQTVQKRIAELEEELRRLKENR
jgi:transcription initiation factor IIE alpha subunit